MQKFILGILCLAIFASAIELILIRHESRLLFIEIQQSYKQRDQLDVIWGKLQLERSAWTHPQKIQQQATKKLHMITPSFDEIIVVK